jgi:succinate dehydrogenase / fumarate reductase flavoprotein subunit
VILATGGGGRAWRFTSNSWEYTGDGFALAYDAGAELINMEFTQFHPTGMVWPPSVRGILVTEGVRGDGGVLKNSTGERFMFGYIPEKFAAETADTVEEADRWLVDSTKNRRPPELLTRDVVARAITREVVEGRGSPHGGVFLDIASRRDPDFIRRKLPSMYHQFKELAGVDITQEPMEVGPTLHYFMGGIRVDADTQMSCVPGLFAAGECSGGMHGANRLGGNGVANSTVFGGIAGEVMPRRIAPDPGWRPADEAVLEAEMTRALHPFTKKPANPNELHEKLLDTMWDNVGVVRDRAGLDRAVVRLAEIEAELLASGIASEDRAFNMGWHDWLNLRSLCEISVVIARAALARENSRGAHYRSDFPEPGDLPSSRFTVARQTASGTQISDRPVEFTIVKPGETLLHDRVAAE